MSTRLPGKKYKSVFDRGRRVGSRLFTAWVAPSDGDGRQVGVIVTKKSFRDAVDRNRAKRILREAFRLLSEEIPEGTEWILSGRSALRNRRTADVVKELRETVRKCVR